MLRVCVISSKGSWEKWLPLAEFSYNKSYQESIKMAPFEALYGRKCRTLLNWVEAGERRYYGIDLLSKLRNKSVPSKYIWLQPNLDRKVMLIAVEYRSSLKLETSFI
jgi:hypothetical protein